MATTTASSHTRDTASLFFTVTVLAGISVLALGFIGTTYNRLVRADQDMRARWTQVQSAAERRVELVPELVQRAEASLDVETISQLSRARGEVLALNRGKLQDAIAQPAVLAQFQLAQQQLSAALHQVLIEAKTRPALEADPRFISLSAQLQGADDRLALERLRFNESAIAFNSLRTGFPTTLVARAFGKRFQPRPLLEDTAILEDATATEF